MKKILFVLMVLATLSSCKTFPIYTENVYYLDFSKHQVDGFSVYASDCVNFDYVNTGIVEVTVYDGMDRRDGKPVKSSYKESSEDFKDFSKSSFMRFATMDDAFIRLKDECTKKGANGVIGVKTEVIRANGYSVKTRGSDIIGYRLTGIAIKK